MAVQKGSDSRHGPDTEHYKSECQVKELSVLVLSHEGAECDQAAARKYDDNAMERINSSNEHRNEASENQNISA